MGLQRAGVPWPSPADGREGEAAATVRYGRRWTEGGYLGIIMLKGIWRGSLWWKGLPLWEDSKRRLSFWKSIWITSMGGLPRGLLLLKGLLRWKDSKKLLYFERGFTSRKGSEKGYCYKRGLKKDYYKGRLFHERNLRGDFCCKRDLKGDFLGNGFTKVERNGDYYHKGDIWQSGIIKK